MTRTTLQLTLVLPQETLIKYQGKNYYFFTEPQFKLVLKLYASYQFAGQHIISLEQNERVLIESLDSCRSQYGLCKDSREILKEDRDFMYTKHKNDAKAERREVFLGKVKIALVSGATGVAAFLLGLLVGSIIK